MGKVHATSWTGSRGLGPEGRAKGLWFTLKTLKLLQIEYYGRGTSAQKALSIRGYSQFANGVWRASEMEMVNHQTRRSTVLNWADYRFDTGVDPRLLTPEALRVSWTEVFPPSTAAG